MCASAFGLRWQNPAEAGWRHPFVMQRSGAAPIHTAKSLAYGGTEKRRRRFALPPQSKPGLWSVVIAE